MVGEEGGRGGRGWDEIDFETFSLSNKCEMQLLTIIYYGIFIELQNKPKKE